MPPTKESGSYARGFRVEEVLALIAERDALREALEKVEPLIDAQFEGHANVDEFMEKARKLNEALDVVRAALERPE